MNQHDAPLFEALIRHKKWAKGNFHVPGHKQGRAFDFTGKKMYSPLLEIDLTELPSLDDLHDPSGVIDKAQRLAAQAFGADHTFFLVGGTTAGNLAAILSNSRPGDQMLVERNVHQSVLHGCMLARVRPVYLGVDRDESDLVQGVKPTQLRAALHRFPEVKGVVITHPNYYGVTQPIEELASICQQHKIPLIVDEAHGAHFGFHPDLPQSAIRRGADLVVQSTHKMLSAMTMGSMLHVQGKRISLDSLRHWLRVIQSSSPSYPLMGSLDLARRYIVTDGEKRISAVLDLLHHFRRNLRSLDHIIETVGWERRDPFKLTIEARRRVSGYRLERYLRKEGCYAELADHRRVLFVFSLGTTEEEIRYLLEKLKQLDDRIPTMKEEPFLSPPSIPEFSISKGLLDDFVRAKQKRIPLQEAADKIAAEMVVPYPPGIPVVLPGEPLSEEVIVFLRKVIDAGGKVRGLHNSQLFVNVIE